MTTGRIGVAISTTGDEHRLGFLETCVKMWDRALPPGASLFVTVDGSAEATRRAQAAVFEWTESVYRVGQLAAAGPTPYSGRLGVAVNKNTGLELLMGAGYRGNEIEHLFLSDDDTWPLFPQSLDKHIDLAEWGVPHSMVVWGGNRLLSMEDRLAEWSWPRGVMLYQRRSVVENVGGMDERFGPGGHEHVEYSQRIHNLGLTPAPFISPASYATRTGKGAAALWSCEDMRKPGETQVELGHRRKAITSVRRTGKDWGQIHKIMEEREGSSDYVAFRAHENGRASATLCQDLMGQGGCAVEPAKPRSEK